MSTSSLVGRIGEFFWLGAAQARVRAYAPRQCERVAALRDAGDRRHRAARRMDDPIAACVLHREAALAYLRAARAAGEGQASSADPSPPELAGGVLHVPVDPSDPRSADDLRRVREAIASADPMFFDGLDGDELDRTRRALVRAVPGLRGVVEARSLTNLRASRAGRIAGSILLAAFVALRIVTQTCWPDLAAGKHVTASSLKPGTPDGQGLVGGGVGTSYAIATNVENTPWVDVDLEKPYSIREVRVFNRVDGWFDDNLPLVVELSLDGRRWDTVERRDATFGHDPPWIVHAGGKRARYVRIQGVGKMGIALSKVSVFGSK